MLQMPLNAESFSSLSLMFRNDVHLGKTMLHNNQVYALLQSKTLVFICAPRSLHTENNLRGDSMGVSCATASFAWFWQYGCTKKKALYITHTTTRLQEHAVSMTTWTEVWFSPCMGSKKWFQPMLSSAFHAKLTNHAQENPAVNRPWTRNGWHCPLPDYWATRPYERGKTLCSGKKQYALWMKTNKGLV